MGYGVGSCSTVTRFFAPFRPHNWYRLISIWPRVLSIGSCRLRIPYQHGGVRFPWRFGALSKRAVSINALIPQCPAARIGSPAISTGYGGGAARGPRAKMRCPKLNAVSDIRDAAGAILHGIDFAPRLHGEGRPFLITFGKQSADPNKLSLRYPGFVLRGRRSPTRRRSSLCTRLSRIDR